MVKVITVGCRLNQAEGDQLSYLNSKRDSELSHVLATGQDSGRNSKLIVIVNTCAVTQEAVRTSWKKIRYYINSKRDPEFSSGQNSKLIVTGCLATLERTKMLNTPGIDMVLTQDEKTSLLNNFQFTSCAQSHIGNFQLNSERSRPIIKIQDGCPNECSFCIARIIRGTPKSVPIEAIIKKINQYIKLGYQEVVLTGLNLGCYGINNGLLLSRGLQFIFDSLLSTDLRIRLSSIEPDTITDELLNLFKSKRLCRHLHIPLQSGDDQILKLMRRKYNSSQYRKLIDKIISKVPGINIGTDIIVGFPYEDESSFNNTLKLVQEVPFGYLHVFPYSTRPGTASAKLPDNVPKSVKKERVRILRELAEKKKQLFKERFIARNSDATSCVNTKLEVLVEDENVGITDNYIRILLPPNKNYQKGKLYTLPIAN